MRGDARMQDGDLRYFSFCTNDVNTQRYIDCVYDEEVALDAHRRGVIVVSRAGDRRVAEGSPCCHLPELSRRA